MDKVYVVPLACEDICTNTWTKPLKRQSRLQQTIFKNIFHCFFQEKRLDVSSESSAEAEDSHEKSSLIFFER